MCVWIDIFLFFLPITRVERPPLELTLEARLGSDVCIHLRSHWVHDVRGVEYTTGIALFICRATVAAAIASRYTTHNQLEYRKRTPILVNFSDGR